MDKGGSFVTANNFATKGTTADGSFAYLESQGSFPGADVGTGAAPEYLATRGANGWSDQLLEVRATTLEELAIKSSVVMSGHTLNQNPTDPRHSIVYSDLALAPGAVRGLVNFYRQDNASRSLTFLGSLPGSNFSLLVSLLTYVSATPDSTHLIVRDYENNQFYEVSGGHATLISVNSSGSPIATPNFPLNKSSGNFFGRGFYPMSTPSGDSFVYSSPTEGAFLNHEGNVTSISVSEIPGAPATPQPVEDVGFSEDGKSVFFVASAGSEPLTSDAVGQPERPLYRYVPAAPPGEHLTYIGSQAGALSISADGETVVYTSSQGGEASLRAWRNGHSEVLDTFDGGLASGQPHLSPNGRFFAETVVEASPQDGTFHAQVNLSDVDRGETVCVSCPRNGAPAVGDAGLGVDGSLAVTDQGEVFFSTETRLVTADSNSSNDAYAYRDGRVRLISRGTPATNALFLGASASGEDVFIRTEDQLATQDLDRLPDIYDARLGGGFAAQNPGPAPAPCSGSACQGQVPGASQLPPAASMTLSDPGSHSRHGRGRCGKGLRKSGSADHRRCVKHHKQKSRRGNRRQGR